jgi:hypothetical protein
LLCLISLLMFIWPVISYRFSLDITLGHQIFMIYHKHLFIKDWSFLWISHVYTWWWVQNMKLLTVQLPPFSCYFIPLLSKYSP